MTVFNSIINEARERFELGDKAETLLSALLSLFTSQTGGGFAGFIERFRQAGLGDTVSSWITDGDNAPLSKADLESALGAETIDDIAAQSGVDSDTTASALAFMTPKVVDTLTPDGEIPDESSLLSTIGGFITGLGGAAASGIGTTGAAARDTVDRIGTAASDTFDKGKDTLGTVGDRVSTTVNRADDAIDSDSESSMLRWLLPLLLLGIVIALGFWFCGKSTPPTTVTNVNVNANANRGAVNTNANTNAAAAAVDASFSIKADNGKYTVSGVVPDEATKKQIMDALTAQYGAANVDFANLRVDAKVKPFAAGWWDNFAKMLPNLKDWKTGSLAFAGNAVTEAAGLPAVALDQLKALFGGWKLPVSVAGAETAAKQANEEALKELGEADSVDEVVKALNVTIINFASGKSDIPADAQPILQKAAEVLKKQSAGTNIEIGGHTDSDGDDNANLKLSQARADAVKKALGALGVSDAMLTAKGYGETEPVAPNDTPDNKFKNRRIAYKTGSGSSPTATTTASTNTNAKPPPANTNAR